MALGAQNARLVLANGWTVSFSPDTPPAFCNVAAWPATDTDTVGALRQRWFDFGDGRLDARCWSLEDVCKALAMVQAAAPPEGVA